jgi:hypothetical protein
MIAMGTFKTNCCYACHPEAMINASGHEADKQLYSMNGVNFKNGMKKLIEWARGMPESMNIPVLI